MRHADLYTISFSFYLCDEINETTKLKQSINSSLTTREKSEVDVAAHSGVQ